MGENPLEIVAAPENTNYLYYPKIQIIIRIL